MHHCSTCQRSFEVRPADLQFLEQVSPVLAGKRYDIPPPTRCPDCRQQRRLAWRNERQLYWRTCDATGKRVLSPYTPDASVVVYDNAHWYSDAWDALEYGRDFDFSRPFFEQFAELLSVVPQLARSAVGNQNCDYVNQCGWCKDCYLIFEADGNESCLYSGYIYDSRSSMDTLLCYASELCYDCINVENSYGLVGCQNAENCSSSFFLKNCIGCKNCFGSVNLRNKEYCWFNEQLTNEAYEARLSEVDLTDFQQYQAWQQKAEAFAQKFPHRSLTGSNNEDSSGDYLVNTQRCHRCFDVRNGQDCAYIGYARNINNVQDMNMFGAEEGASFCYEVHEVGGGVRNLVFCDQVWDGSEGMLYSKLCIQQCRNLFGCLGLKKKSYCILNKQYTQDEYEALLPKIIDHMRHTGEWGEFFPASISPFGYNETIAQVHFPLTQVQAEEQGWRWQHYEEPIPDVEKTIPAERLPNRLEEVPDDILNWAIVCEKSGKPFRIVPQELAFYREQKLPLPRLHPDERHRKRLQKRNPWRLWFRSCDKCGGDLQSSISPERSEPIYCVSCYQQAVV